MGAYLRASWLAVTVAAISGACFPAMSQDDFSIKAASGVTFFAQTEDHCFYEPVVGQKLAELDRWFQQNEGAQWEDLKRGMSSGQSSVFLNLMMQAGNATECSGKGNIVGQTLQLASAFVGDAPGLAEAIDRLTNGGGRSIESAPASSVAPPPEEDESTAGQEVEDPPADPLTSLAKLTGACQKFIMSGQDLTKSCSGSIVQSVYDVSGRTGFTVTLGRKGAIVTLSGFQGAKPDPNTQLQSLDKLILNLNEPGVPPSIQPVTGSCSYANPYNGPMTISCQATDPDGGGYLLLFVTNGSDPVFIDPL